MKQRLLTILLTLMPMMASADAVLIDGIYYNLVSKAKEAEVTSSPNMYSGDIVIPTSVTYENIEFNVTSIGEGAFNSCSGLTSVTIPNSVLSIGKEAFQWCRGLKSVVIPNSVTSIGQGAFQVCSGLTSVDIPNSVTSIGDYAFNYCSGLTSLSIPNSVTSIGNNVFTGCSALTSLTIPNNVNTIGYAAFQNCTGLTSVTIPSSVTAIYQYAFEGCSGLTSLTIGENVTLIGNNAFANCTELRKVYCLAENVPAANNSTFEGSYPNYITLYVPSASIDKYMAQDPWKNFKSIVSVDKIYILTYEVDGQEYKTYELAEGESITPEPAPTKEGYTFSGWSEIPEKMPSHNVTVTGSFTINKYKLIYQVDGADYKIYEVEYGATITPEVAPTKEGYTFSGWNDLPQTMPAKDVTVNGTFTINKYKLVYMVDGSVYKTYDIEYGTTITPEVAPTKEGYTFSGWNDLPQTMPAKDVTVNGTFTINKYKLTYLVDNEVYSSYDVEYGATITPEAPPTKGNYIFSGWSDIPQTMPAHDVTVTGSFTYAPPKAYTLTYMVDGEVYKTVSYYEGDAITPEAEPTKEGYTFSGWSYIPSTMPAEDVTVTGTFTVNKYTLTYKVDGVVYKSYEIAYGSNITPEAEPTKEGYAFSGWSDIPQTMPAHDVTVTGTFTKGAYKLIYMVDGEVYKTVSYDYGETITPEAEPTKEGYTFSGWSEIPSTMPANDVTVYGTFTVNKYTLTYMVDGEVYKTYKIEYGAAITPEPAPSKEGYNFSGWDNVPETMPAHDVIVYGSLTVGITDIFINFEEVKIFDTKGNQIGRLKKGINILVYKNGERKKVIIQ